MAVPVSFLLGRRSRVGHRDVVSTRHRISQGSSVSLTCVAVVSLVFAFRMSALLDTRLLTVTSYVVQLDTFLYFSQSLVEVVFAVARDIFVYFSF
jgi:hypothetical protein